MLDKYTESEPVRNTRETNFTYHRPKPDQPARYEAIRAQAGELSRSLNGQCPPGRELSLAQTKLEEAVFWANAAIARGEGS